MRAHRVTSPNGAREDVYYWLRDDSRSDADVLSYLEAENRYTDAMLGPVQPLIDQLYTEIVARLKQDDATVPVRYRGFWYAVRYQTGQEYPIVVRWADRPGAEELVLLDGNALASGQPFYQLGGYEISPDNRLLAYTEDTVGRRQYRLRVKDLVTGTLLPDVIENVEGGIAWADDNRTLLYVEKDPVTLLGRRVRRHELGSTGEDPLVYEEPDESFDLSVDRSKSERYLLIGSESTTSSEWRYARADDASFNFRLVLPREEDHEYQLDHLDSDLDSARDSDRGSNRDSDFDGRFVIRTNWQALNFRIVEVPVAEAAERDRWRDVVSHDPEVFIQDFELFRTFIAVSERSLGLMNIRVQRWGEAPFHLTADDPAYTMALGSNPELDSTKLRYVYTSLTTPGTTYDYDLTDGSRTFLKREPVLGDFDPANYASEFVWAPARDGERIPVSIVYRKGTPLNGTAPLYQYGYGSYGLSIEPAFSSSRLSLLDRGFVYALAHIRGGQELGRRWYDAGRLEHKWNTFNDFVDVTDHLIARGYGARDKIFAAGGSAGGLLMGVIANVAPDRYAALVAHVPFVDIVTTMLDTSIPLTTLEYDEWGNPNDAAAYAYMLSYSPYDNIRRQSYPAVLVTTGLWDSQVQYYEPAKWVAKLRQHNTGSAPLLLHVNLEAGHGGKSGRYEHMREVAREYGFVIAIAEGVPLGPRIDAPVLSGGPA